MIVAVQASRPSGYSQVLDGMFRTRKTVFFDTLCWDVSLKGDWERDRYDDLDPTYLIWCDRKRVRHYGSVRLMPTTGPTLLQDVFNSTFSDPSLVIGEGIWEGTRMCLDEMALQRDFPNLVPSQAFNFLLLALCEFGLDNAIHTFVSNYAPAFKRVYTRAGAEVREVGRSTVFGKVPICCGAFAVTPTIHARMQHKLGAGLPVYDALDRFSSCAA